MKKFINIIQKLKCYFQLESEWHDALAWAKAAHPSWVQLAMQRNRPEIQETYRQKILRGYCDRCW